MMPDPVHLNILENLRRELTLLIQVLQAVRPIPLQRVVEGTEPIVIRTVVVATAGTTVQGPDMSVHPGFSISIRQRRHTTSRTGYVGFSRTVITRSDTRVELQNNDSIVVRITNFNQVWFDASANSTTFEMMAVR